jgi:hypothetical protein
MGHQVTAGIDAQGVGNSLAMPFDCVTPLLQYLAAVSQALHPPGCLGQSEFRSPGGDVDCAMVRDPVIKFAAAGITYAQCLHGNFHFIVQI